MNESRLRSGKKKKKRGAIRDNYIDSRGRNNVADALFMSTETVRNSVWWLGLGMLLNVETGD